jgi:hypothetical protein
VYRSIKFIYIVTYLGGGVTYRRGMYWWTDLLTTCIYNSELRFTDHWHTQTSVLSLLKSPLAVSWQRLLPREILQLLSLRSSCHSRPCRTLCQVTTQLTGSQPGSHFIPTFQSSLHRLPSNWTPSLTIQQLLHVTSLKLTADNCNSGTRLILLIIFLYDPHRKHCFHFYSPAVPRPLYVYSLRREVVYRAVT